MKELNYSVHPDYITKDPARKSLKAAGIDVYLPMFTNVFKADLEKMNDKAFRWGRLTETSLTINPYFRVLIPTGLFFDIPDETYIDVATKSGMFRDTGLKVGSHVLDSDYQGMVYISLFNTSKIVASLSEGDGIAQLIHKAYEHSFLKKMSYEGLYPEKSIRGDGGFGSTGK